MVLSVPLLLNKAEVMESATQDFCDVAIIGGGLAGSAAAIQLAKAGVRVWLFEREAQAHHKVCGEFLSYEAQHYLSGLGINLEMLGAVPLDRFGLTHLEKSVSVPLPFKAMSLSRYRLDQALLNQAARLGAQIKRVNITSLDRLDEQWQIKAQNEQIASAKAVFLATGKHDLRGISNRGDDKDNYIGFKMHFLLHAGHVAQRSSSVEIILFDGGYAGIEPIEDNKINLCLVITKEKFAASDKNWSTLLTYLVAKIPYLAMQFADATPCWDKPIAISGIPYGFVYRPSLEDAPTLFRIGDQAAVIPSICGDGMAIALHTGSMAAQYYLKFDANLYHTEVFRQLSPQIAYSIKLSRLLSMPLFQFLALPLCRMMPKLLNRAIRKTRLQTMLALCS